MSLASALISTQNHVETPFIIVQIGDYLLGHCAKPDRFKLSTAFNIEYPNYMETLNIVKVNGAINTYVITMVYAITEQDDPNRLEKIFSSVSKSRMIKLSYGDWNAPSFIYKNEEAIITKLTTNVDMKSSSIRYTINCTSNALTLTGSSVPFPRRIDKPSNVIKELLASKEYNLIDIFPGMKNLDFVNFIAGDDKRVRIDAQPAMNVLDYISYLVSCMVYVKDPERGLKSCCYYWSIYDDVSNKYGGTYFKVVKVAANTQTSLAYNTYEVDIGYPTDSNVLDFVVKNDDSWSLLYDYAQNINMPEYSYSIDSTGKLVQQDSSFVTQSTKTFETTEANRNWWSLMTQFPITASLTIKGLLRPAMLMSYVKVNTYFFGHKHTSSGLYIVTKQEDSISGSGYKTTLSLTRVGGDERYV